MARIIVCAMSNVTWLRGRHVDSFVEGLIRALSRSGNDILNIRVNDFRFGGHVVVSRAALREKIKNFGPDLILTLNNEFPYPELIDETTCPIACLAADSYAFFSNKEKIRKFPERYYFFNFSNDTIKTLKDWFPEAYPDRNVLFGHATDLRATAIEQDIDLSFVGSIANWNRELVGYFQRLPNIPGMSYPSQNEAKAQFFELFDRFRDDPFMTLKSGCLPAEPSWRLPLEASFIHLLTCQQRFKTLSVLSDLGLKLFGYPHAYSELLLYDEKLFRCFDFTPSVTMDHATQTYNRSKISLNLPHGHAQEGFSWRVCDVLASNATLLSCRQPDLVALSKGYVDLPMFDSPAEARELAVKLLADPLWRKDISVACQGMIEDKCRFEPKFRIMEQVIPGVSMFASSAGTVEWLDGADYCSTIQIKKIEFLRLVRNALLLILNQEITVGEAFRSALIKGGRKLRLLPAQSN